MIKPDKILFVIVIVFNSRKNYILAKKQAENSFKLPEITITGDDIPIDGLRVLRNLTGLDYDIKELTKLPEKYQIEDQKYIAYIYLKSDETLDMEEGYQWLDYKKYQNKFENPIYYDMITDAIYFLTEANEN